MVIADRLGKKADILLEILHQVSNNVLLAEISDTMETD